MKFFDYFMVRLKAVIFAMVVWCVVALVVLAVVLFVNGCSSALNPPPVLYDAGVATCEEADAVARECPFFDFDGGDFLSWCKRFTRDGAYTIDLACLAEARSCESAENCLNH